MKTITLYGLQALVGVVALAAGYAKLTGMSFMVEPFAMVGIGHGVLMVAGAVEGARGVRHEILLLRGMAARRLETGATHVVSRRTDLRVCRTGDAPRAAGL